MRPPKIRPVVEGGGGKSERNRSFQKERFLFSCPQKKTGFSPIEVAKARIPFCFPIPYFLIQLVTHSHLLNCCIILPAFRRQVFVAVFSPVRWYRQ